MSSAVEPSVIRVIRHASELGRWEIAERGPRRGLRPYVRRYGGFDEDTRSSLRRREFASPDIVLVIDFSRSLRVRMRRDATGWAPHGCGFVAGLQASCAVTEHDGVSRGIIVCFTAMGARLFLDRPLRDLAGRAVALEDACGPTALELQERLYEAPSWDARFSMLDEFIASHISVARACPAVVVEALRRIDECGGNIDVRGLSSELGCTRKHLHARFQENVGIAPKLFARIVRFDRAVKRIEGGLGNQLASIAQECGYYDQSHLIRDFRTFSGGPPREFLRRSRPDFGGVSDE